MEKIVKTGLRDCTVNLDGTECAVRFDGCFRVFAVRNDSSGDVYISKTAGIAPDADGVMSVKAGASTVYAHMDMHADTVYLLGKGKVQLHAQNDVINPFNYAPAMDGGEERGESSYTIENAVDYPVMGLNLYGKSTQDGTPTPENPVEIVSVGDGGSVGITACGKNLLNLNKCNWTNVTINGVSFVRNNNGEIIVNGTATATVSRVLGNYDWQGKIPVGKYYISGCPKTDVGGGTCRLQFTYATSSSGTKQIWQSNAMETVFTLPNDYTHWGYTIVISEGFTANNLVFKPMLCPVDSERTFEPYHGATANITTAMPLCGIPVESGGNYTDSYGQQWVCDEMIYRADGTGKIVKHIGSYTISSSSDVHLVENAGVYRRFAIWNIPHKNMSMSAPCTAYKYKSGFEFDGGDIDSYADCFVLINSTARFVSNATTVDEFIAKNTGIKFTYPLAEPQEIELTAAEMTVLRELQTYNGVTNIFNDGGADMSVGYCTNKMLSEYVVPITMGLQKQIDELKSAVLSLGGNI